MRVPLQRARLKFIRTCGAPVRGGKRRRGTEQLEHQAHASPSAEATGRGRNRTWNQRGVTRGQCDLESSRFTPNPNHVAKSRITFRNRLFHMHVSRLLKTKDCISFQAAWSSRDAQDASADLRERYASRCAAWRYTRVPTSVSRNDQRTGALNKKKQKIIKTNSPSQFSFKTSPTSPTKSFHRYNSKIMYEKYARQTTLNKSSVNNIHSVHTFT